MRAVITGSNGFVGRNLACALHAAGAEVFGVTRPLHPDGKDAGWGDRPREYRWDISQAAPAELIAAIEGFSPTHVFHFAAISRVKDCGYRQPNALAQSVNVEGTRRAIEIASRIKPVPRFLFASTSYVYAPKGGEPLCRESDPCEPTTGYGVTKLAGEAMTHEAAAAGAIQGVVVRPFHHTGPGQSVGYVLPDWVAQIARGESPLKVRTLKFTIDLSDIRDAVRAYRMLAERDVTGTFNLGAGVRRSGAELVAAISAAAADPLGGGAPLSVIETHAGEDPAGRVRHNPAADIEKIAAAIGWRPEIPFEQTVADTLEYWRHRLNPEPKATG